MNQYANIILRYWCVVLGNLSPGFQALFQGCKKLELSSLLCLNHFDTVKRTCLCAPYWTYMCFYLHHGDHQFHIIDLLVLKHPQLVVVYCTDDLVEILSRDMPDDCDTDFYTNYCTLIVSMFHSLTRNLRELKYLTAMNFNKYREPVLNSSGMLLSQATERKTAVKFSSRACYYPPLTQSYSKIWN